VRPADFRTYADASDLRGASELADRLARLPDGHPSKPDRPSDGPGEARRLTDAEHTAHVADVKWRLTEAEAAGLATHIQHTVDSRNEVWSYDRRLVHDVLVHSLYAKASRVPCDGHAIVAGGLPGAGKTTVLTQHTGIDLTSFLTINPDQIKAEMARRGLMPEISGLTPMEASRLAHEEASHLAKRLAHRAHAEGRNVIWDVTMSNVHTCANRIGALQAAGYARVEAIFVDIPIALSVSRADARHRQGHDEYRAGIGLGGRFLAHEMILAQADSAWGSVNRASFEHVRERFSAWARYDNSVDGRAATLVAEGTGMRQVRRSTLL
jgi:adenylate kinase